MKAKFLALAALVLGLASCQTEPEGFDVVLGGEVDATICVEIPEAETRAMDSAQGIFGTDILDGDATMRYILEIYHNGELAKERQVRYGDGTEMAFPVRLVPGRAYDFVVWADVVTAEGAGDNHYVTTSDAGLTNITLNTDVEWKAMDETRDAFTGVMSVTSFSNSSDISFDLIRPFAKLRVRTTDIKDVLKLGIDPTTATVEYTTDHRQSFNARTVTYGTANLDKTQNVDYRVVSYEVMRAVDTYTLFADYFFADNDIVNFTLDVKDANGTTIGEKITFNTPINVRRNYLTTITGNLLTDANNVNVEIKPGFDGTVDEENGEVATTTNVDTKEEFVAAFKDASTDIIILNGDINLNDVVLTRAAYTAMTVKNGETLTIDLNGHKLSATTTQDSGNQELFLVKGTLTVKNGTIEYQHTGANMGWGYMTTIFDVTAGGVLNLDGVTAKNLGGSDMAFVAHLNNWGEVTLNVDNSTLEANYVPVRVFNSGNDMNNVTITNSTLTGVSAAFWVHNYTVEDFGTEAKAEAQKALLNLNIYNQGNTFSPDVNGIRYGFTNSIRTDAYGITKSVSEDGTEVTLGSIVENGLIRRGVAGDEENTTITKVVVEEGVGVLYDRTFRRFYALETVVLPSTLTTIGAAGSGVFQSCTNLKNIVIPESVTVLGKGSFQECSSLESINIPSGVTRIEADALRATGLKSVEFHAGVTYFGAQAFRDCKQLTEVIINAPEFTMEGNTFGIMAAPFTPMTIYVANTAMKTYVESKLTAHAKTYITVVAPTEVGTTADINKALANGEDVVLTGDIAVAKSEAGSNGYGATGISQLNGGTIDGNGNDISVNAWGTWDSAINTTGGIIKNLNVTGGMRGIFVNHNSTNNSKVILENVTIDGTIYTISCDQGTNNGLEATNSTFNGWTSYAATIGDVKFTGCNFGEGQGYAFCRPYAPTEFVGCEFEAGFTVDPVVAVTFENCTLDGVAITAANIADLVTDTANVTIK